MQIIDIKITPAADAESMSRVCFIGEGGDEVAVTISDHHEGGATIDQELVAKAKVMLLHAAAAQIREMAATEAEIVPESELGDEEGEDLPPPEEDEGNPFQNPDETMPSDEAEETITRSIHKTSERSVE